MHTHTSTQKKPDQLPFFLNEDCSFFLSFVASANKPRHFGVCVLFDGKHVEGQ